MQRSVGSNSSVSSSVLEGQVQSVETGEDITSWVGGGRGPQVAIEKRTFEVCLRREAARCADGQE